jgi:hypothetical protein
MMSRRMSERKAKTAASSFLKHVTGAKDWDRNGTVSLKRKLVECHIIFSS